MGKDAKSTEKVEEQTTKCSKTNDILLKYSLPISLIVAVILGVFVPWPGGYIDHPAVKYTIVAWVFINSGLYMKSSEIKTALKEYKAIIWGFTSILFVTTAIGSQLTGLLVFDPNTSPPNYITNNSLITSQSTNLSTSGGVYIGPQELVTGIQVYMLMPCAINSGVIMVTQVEMWCSLFS